MPSITSANAVFQIAVNTVFPIPVQMQGFSADDIFTTNPLETSEVLMGVDGILSAGFVFVPVKQEISLMADSGSATLFDLWFAAQQAAKDVFQAQGIVILPSINLKWSLLNGFLSTYHAIPDARKILQPRRFAITWQSMIPSLI
jgi:hypothetical protein